VIPPNTLVVEAPAKVNLSLRVLGRRQDGYHDIESLMAPLSLADRLRVHAHADPTEFRTLSLSLEVRGDPGLVRPVPTDDSNLVIRAALALAERAEIRGFAEFVLDKRTPTAAGLGGGSSDAAAALRALNALWGCSLDEGELREVGAGVGSDVPALLGDGPVLVSGRGEIVVSSAVAAFDLVLVPFDFSVNTADAYRWWDEDGGPHDEDTHFPNDLAEPVMKRHPRIRDARDLLRTARVPGVLTSGSGPTVAGILSPGAGRLDPAMERSLEALSGRPVLYASLRGTGPGS